jgi:Skp family chaperone for outer membrane proteins
MKRHLQSSLLAAVVAAFVGWICGQGAGAFQPAWAFDNEQTSPRTPEVATIDMSRIFKEHKQFLAQSAALRKRMVEAEETINTQKGDVEQLEKKLKDVKTGTEERRELQQQIDLRNVAINAATVTHKRNFTDEEARLYAQIYESVVSEVKKLADAKGIRMVLRVSRQAYDINNYEEVIRVLNRQVVYQRDVEITDDILSFSTPNWRSESANSREFTRAPAPRNAPRN